MEEIWKDIKGFEGKYQISNIGNVKSLEREVRNTNNSTRIVKERILKLQNNPHKYKMVAMSKESYIKPFVTHRLVATAFIPNPENKPCVNHINGIRWDNRVENLEWCTHKENTRHMIDVLGFRKTAEMIENSAKTKRKKVINEDTGQVYESVKSCAIDLGISRHYLSGQLTGNEKKVHPIKFL